MENRPQPFMRPNFVHANATVDNIGKNQWVVEVWGLEPHDFTRRYEITAKSDTLAAQEGIRRFVEEMEARKDH